MNGYELAELLRVKVTMTTAMQAADKLVELEDYIFVLLATQSEKESKKTGKKNESKPSGNKDKTSVSEQREAIVDNGSESNLSRTDSKPDFNEPLLSDASEMGNAKPD
jgi:hypothetical protein